MLERTIRKYQNRSINAAQVIAELVELAKDMREARKRGEELHMSEEELAFYDALEVNDAAVRIMGDEVLRQIAHELVDAVAQCDDRLDGQGKRSRQAPGDGEAHLAEIRLPTRQAGEGDTHGSGTGRAAV